MSLIRYRIKVSSTIKEQKMAIQKEFMAWQQERAKELFALSHRLFDTAKDFSDHQMTEIKASMDHAKSYADHVVASDIESLKELQQKFSKEAAVRVSGYQKKIKALLKSMEDETAEEVDKHLTKARSAMESWLKDAGKNFPEGSDKLNTIVRDIAHAGEKVLKEGRKMAKQAAAAAEDGLAAFDASISKNAFSKATPVKKTTAKKTAAKKRAAKKPVVKTVVAKKPAVKKVAAKKAPVEKTSAIIETGEATKD
jgi:uncharacterized protein YukE